MEPFKDLSDVDLFELKQRTNEQNVHPLTCAFFSAIYSGFFHLPVRFVPLLLFIRIIFIFIFHRFKYIGKLSLRAIGFWCEWWIWRYGGRVVSLYDFFYRFTAILRRSNNFPKREKDMSDAFTWFGNTLTLSLTRIHNMKSYDSVCPLVNGVDLIFKARAL